MTVHSVARGLGSVTVTTDGHHVFAMLCDFSHAASEYDWKAVPLYGTLKGSGAHLSDGRYELTVHFSPDSADGTLTLQLVSSANSVKSLSPADTSAVTEVWTHLRSLTSVNAMIQYLSQKQSQFAASRRSALATGARVAIQILKSGASTIYSATWEQKFLGNGTAAVLRRTVTDVGVYRTHQDFNWKANAVGIAGSDAGGALIGAVAGAPAFGLGAGAGALAVGLGSSMIAAGGTIISLGV